MRNAKWCLLALSSVWLFGFTDGGCFGFDEPGQPDDPPPAACEGLDERACLASDGCVAVYDQVAVDCFCAPCREGEDCPLCDCGGGVPTTYSHCAPSEPTCPAVCDIYCEFGNVLDENGCETCSCNPPPGPCEVLDERACVSTPGCAPIYGGVGGGGACECPGCFGGDCPPCDCAEEPAPRPDPGFQGCVTVDRCANLSERECVATPGCAPAYGGACPAIACDPDDPSCPTCDPAEGYLGWSDADCEPGFVCEYAQPGGGSGGAEDCACRCDDAGNCYDCDCGGARPEPAGVCVPAEPGCRADVDCGPNGHCWDGFCYHEGCRTDDECAGGLCVEGVCTYPTEECWDDSECPGGYCELFDCGAPDGADCIRAGGQCVYVSCDDGQPTLCDMIPPECAPGQVAAARDGCWECVDARTCQPVDDECWGAWVDETGTCRAPNDGVYPAYCCGVACEQVVTYAADPATGACYAFATPCDVPPGWGACAR